MQWLSSLALRNHFVRVGMLGTMAAGLAVLPACSDSGSDDKSATDGLTKRLSDRLFKVSSTEANSGSDAFLNRVNTTLLCAAGRFARQEVAHFSTSAGSSSTEALSNGTWSVVTINGEPYLQLQVEQSNPPAENLSPRFKLSQQADGSIAFNGTAATESDGAGECAIGAKP